MSILKYFVDNRYFITPILQIFRYESGDHVAVFPTNNPELVEKIGKLCDTDLDTVFSLNNLDGMCLKRNMVLINEK